MNEIAFAFEDREAVEQAVTLFEQGSCGFSDCLIVAMHTKQRCTFTATFDRAMRHLLNVKIISNEGG